MFFTSQSKKRKILFVMYLEINHKSEEGKYGNI